MSFIKSLARLSPCRNYDAGYEDGWRWGRHHVFEDLAADLARHGFAIVLTADGCALLTEIATQAGQASVAA